METHEHTTESYLGIPDKWITRIAYAYLALNLVIAVFALFTLTTP